MSPNEIPSLLAPGPTPTAQSVRNAWIFWIFANALGHVAGISAFGIFNLVFSVGAIGSEGIGAAFGLVLPLAIFGLLDGLMLGLAQGLVLQRFTGRRILGEWLFVTSFGSIAAWVMGLMLGAFTSFDVIFFVITLGLTVGAVIGLVQRPSLRRHLDPMGGWVIPNLLGGGVAVLVGTFMLNFLGSVAPESLAATGVGGLLLSVGVAGLAYGAITARPLMTLLDSYRVSIDDSTAVDDISQILRGLGR